MEAQTLEKKTPLLQDIQNKNSAEIKAAVDEASMIRARCLGRLSALVSITHESIKAGYPGKTEVLKHIETSVEEINEMYEMIDGLPLVNLF